MTSYDTDHEYAGDDKDELEAASATLDRLLAEQPIAPPTLAGAVGKKCGHYKSFRTGNPDGGWTCRCGKVVAGEQVKAGRRHRRRGNNGELRSRDRYGWIRVGQYGGIDDLLGRLFIVQQKTTKAAPPATFANNFRRLDERAGGRMSLLLLSYVRQGVPAEDYIVIRGRDWLALMGRDEPEPQPDDATVARVMSKVGTL